MNAGKYAIDWVPGDANVNDNSLPSWKHLAHCRAARCTGSCGRRAFACEICSCHVLGTWSGPPTIPSPNMRCFSLGKSTVWCWSNFLKPMGNWRRLLCKDLVYRTLLPTLVPILYEPSETSLLKLDSAASVDRIILLGAYCAWQNLLGTCQRWLS